MHQGNDSEVEKLWGIREKGLTSNERSESSIIESTEHRAPSTEAPSTEHRAPSTEHRARAPSTEHRAPSTEHRAPSTVTARRAHLLLANVVPPLVSRQRQHSPNTTLDVTVEL